MPIVGNLRLADKAKAQQGLFVVVASLGRVVVGLAWQYILQSDYDCWDFHTLKSAAADSRMREVTYEVIPAIQSN